MKKNSVKRNIEDILALTPMQEGMLYHWLKDPGSDHYFEQLSLDISGKIDPERFEKAWNFVIETNEMLRTAFRWEKVDNPVQIILREYSLQPEYYDLSRDEESQKKNRLEGIKFEDSCKKFDLRFVPFRVSLCKLEEDKHVMILSNHHILFDGWSNGIILSEFLTAYNEYGHSMIPMKAAKMKFKEYVKWIGSRDIKEQKAYWNNYLKGLTSSCELSIKNRGSKISPHEFENERAGNENIEPRQMSKYNVCFFEVSKIKLEEFCKKYNITSASLFYSAWGLLLQRYNNTGDVLFGTTVSGRSAKVNGIEEMVGLFINTLPLRVKSSGSTSLEQLLKNINQILQERGVFENTPLMEIKEYSEWHGEGELFDTLLTIENYPLDSRLNEIGPGLSMQSYSMKERTHYDLSVSIMMVDDISIDIHYNAESIEAGTIRELAGHFHRIICGIIENPCRRIAEFDMLSDEEKYRLLEQFNTAGPGYAQDKTVVHLFDEQVEKTPWNTALAGQTFFTYAQLNEKANQVACHLMEAGVGPGSIVGIMTDRSFEMIIGIFGILKAGGAYLPIDPDFPGERIHYMLKDSGARILLSSEIRNPGSSRDQTNPTIQNTNDSNKNQCFPCSVLNFEHFNFESCFTFRNSQFRISNFKSSDLSYVIYTSGSTGRPKGVIVEHSALTNLLFTLQEKYPFGPNDTYLLKTSFIFDVSLSEIFGWFMGGGRLAVLEKHGEKEPQAILNAIEHFNVTHINFVPAMFNVFLDCLPLENARQLPGLKCVFLAGEAVLPESVNRFNRLGTGVLLENLYGPTEATVYASLYSLKNWDGSGAVPIGKPLSNVRLYILGPYGNLQAVGIPGELCIAGAGLARGYLNQPGLTAEKFVTFVEPQITQRKNFNNKPAAVKLYKTGDLARWSADGNIEFLGRLDHQVKIRGFRIELGEIENQLLKLPEVNEAVVVVRENQVPDRYLCAYVVTVTRDVVWDGEVETGETGALKEQLARHLPGYMIPTYIVRVDEIPLTASGKVNRQALPVPQAEASELYTAPRNELEKRLAKIWAAVLSFDPSRPLPGIDDNFFGLSGHSLNVTNLVGRINKRLRVRIPFNQIFRSPTIRGLAEYISDTGMGDYQPLEAVEQREYYALSSRQNR
ncbi:MAG: amino acid adenylation domain-containing protein, partial [bacterium]|nr:amino acid adenylation domain-containing protein [bacterium]